MSIYASFCCMGEDEEIPAPLAYLQSHVLPSQGGYRCGSLDLGLIPGFITENGWCVHGVDHTVPGWDGFDHADKCEPLDELPAVWPFLRVSVRPVSHPSMAEYGEIQEMVERLRRDHGGCADDCVALLRADLLDRVSDPEDTVVLDRSQVEKLRDHLTEWLGRTSG